MITSDGWLDWAERVPGPADKVYAQPNTIEGYVPHSAVGYYSGWSARLFSTDRRPDGRYTSYAAASVHGWIGYDGSVIQHYPFTASCWASDSIYPNTHFVAFENEGGFRPENEPLRPAQLAANVRIITELRTRYGWHSCRRPTDEQDVSAQLYEHNECTRWGSAATSCPSSRIPWDIVVPAVQDKPVIWTPPGGNYGVRSDPPFLYIEVGGVPVLRIGDAAGQFPGRIAKLFGDTYWHLKMGQEIGDGRRVAIWEVSAGD